ncbi:hypothetical protein QUA42_10940 [Microcoleus sp. Pol11C2]|uniref:hypothetical protein n=1 Tax=Microcoleus sp. Pol11C2 TaxID=3055389 RepID=UPI002FCEA0DF
MEISYPVAVSPLESSLREHPDTPSQSLTEQVIYYYWRQQLFRQIEARSPANMKI